MAQGLYSMMEHPDYSSYASTFGFTEESNNQQQDDDIANLERQIISAARKTDTLNKTPKTPRKSKASKKEDILSMPTFESNPAPKKRVYKRKDTNDDLQKISTFASNTSSSENTTSTRKRAKSQFQPRGYKDSDSDVDGDEDKLQFGTTKARSNFQLGQQERQERQVNQSTTSDSTSSTNDSSNSPTIQPYETYKATIDTCKGVMDSVALFAQTIDSPLRKHTDICTKELNLILDHFNTCMQSSCCFFCKQSPTNYPQRVKAVACGHFFSCLTCLVNYVASSNGQFSCPRCNKSTTLAVE